MKKKNSNPLPPMKLTDSESTAVSCALDFMLHYDSYSYDTAKFDHTDVSDAAWNADSGKINCRRKEVRAVAAAIELSLHCIANNPDAVQQVESVFPDLIPDLRAAVPVLDSLRPRVAAYMAKLANRN